ncbi:MAG: hypothetical protein ACRD1S_05860 [Vicinamibacterales bacterium]
MKVAVAAVVGGLIVFVWSAIAHMATPLGTAGLSTLPGEDAVVAALRASGAGSGLYFIPGGDENPQLTPEQQMARHMEKLQAGPVGLLAYTAGPGEAMSPRQLLSELATSILAAGVAAFLVSMMVGSLGQRAIAVSLLALFATFSVTASYWIWYGFPTPFIGAGLVTEAIGWLLAGFAIAKIVPPPAAPARATAAV